MIHQENDEDGVTSHHQQEDSGATGNAHDGGHTEPLSAEQQTLAVLQGCLHRHERHWRPSHALAKALSVPLRKLMLTQQKEDAVNLVWATVLSLTFCATRLADIHDQWYEVAAAAVEWLRQQPHFVENRDDLVTSACTLLHAPDTTSSLLASVFAEPVDEETLALEEALGDWKICYLDQPPYSMYFWNEQSNLSTWRNPIETAKQEHERLEKRKQREVLLAKWLPQRLVINRDRYQAPTRQACMECDRRGNRPALEANVMCIACGHEYLCENCCDERHADRTRAGHVDDSFRFRDCLGISGFR